MRYGAVVLLGGIGALLFWLTGLTGNSGADDLAELERLRAGAGVSVTGTMTDVHEREQRSGGRRGMRVHTVFCPVYSFADGDLRSTIIGDCERDRDDLPALGSTIPVIYDPDGYTRFIDTDEVASGLARSGRTYPWYRWGGLALALVCGLVVVGAIGRGIAGGIRRSTAARRR
ncbi:hypothetical protein FE697_011180 [Mumia zhuanghuii]|uniref:DUF3592 domain-containing protein n=2 Tax=Mumia TaxID=1546255 RepID=A0ABW1QF02_9ACTN|nr:MULTISPECIES: DUF3592 domain-containing protein [Mumia]KAA1422727.1 hypothetical protein FE697_011180 [Mumia zhuanghuii]